ncbi:conserved hypothetical protein, partial [Ricinus communis]
MEAFQSELVAQALLGAGAAVGPGAPAQHVARRLARLDAVALDLAGDRAFGVAQGFRHVGDGLLAAPAPGVDAG